MVQSFSGDHIVLDVEIRVPIDGQEVTFDDTDKLGMSCCCMYSMTHDAYHVYGDTDEELQSLRSTILHAGRVTTFNGWKFDLPLIWGVRREIWTRNDDMAPQAMDARRRLEETSDDLLRRAWQASGLDPDIFTKAHAGYSLNAIATATLGRGKTGRGEFAPQWYRRGLFGPLVSYCLQDVWLTRNLCRYIDEHGFCLVDKNGGIKQINIPAWSTQTDAGEEETQETGE